MARERNRVIELDFPIAGLSKAVAVQKQPPYTTPAALNVRPFDTLANRARGGSRPGLTDFVTDTTGGVINLLARLDQSPDDGYRVWSDSFDWTTNLPNGWAPSSLNSAKAPIADGGYLRHDYAASNPQGVLAMPHLPLAISQQFVVRYRIPTVDITLDNGTTVDVGNGEFGLLFHQIPNYVGYTQKWFANVAFTNSFKTAQVIIKFDNGSAVYDQTTSVDNVAELETLEFVVADKKYLRVFWAGQLIGEYTLSPVPSDATKNRLGIYLKSTESAKSLLVSSVEVSYFNRDYSAFAATKSIAVLASGGQLYKQNGTDLETAGGATAVSTTFPIRAVSFGGKLYIADRLATARAQGSNGYIDEVLNGGVYEARLKDTSETDFTNNSISAGEHYAVLTNPSGGVAAGSYGISAVAAGYLTLSGYPVGNSATKWGKGGCTYRVERAPLLYDPYTATVSAWKAADGKGIVPAGCPIIQTYQGRIVLAGMPAHAWWMSRRGDPDDWDYLASYGDVSQAAFGTLPCAITAIMPAIDSSQNGMQGALFFAGVRELYVLTGDIGAGAAMNIVSASIGVVSPDAWCYVPEGGIVFLAQNGLYYLPSDSIGKPQPLTRDKLPDGLIAEAGWTVPPTTSAPDTPGSHFMMAYDERDEGIHIYAYNAPVSGLPATALRSHWWFCWRTKSLWPVEITADDCLPTRMISHRPDGALVATAVLAGRDGQLRYFSPAASTDDGTGFSSYFDIGPFMLASNGNAGKITSLDATLANDSAAVAYYAWTGDDAESVATAVDGYTSGSVSRDGRNPHEQIELGGAVARIRIGGQAYSRWAIEKLLATIRPAGRFRMEA